MATLAFENHGHLAPGGCGASPLPACTIYSPVVQGGLNFAFSILANRALALSGPSGTSDPCIEDGPGEILPLGTGCGGLWEDDTSHGGAHAQYETPIALLPIAASNTPSKVVPAALGSVVDGQTYLQVAQRLINTIAWAQIDCGAGHGSWRYTLDKCEDPDGSTHGWNVLALFDGQAFGATIPGFVMPEVESTTAYLTNANGSMGYRIASQLPNTAKTGVRLQSLSLVGIGLGDTNALTTVTPQESVDWINDGWGIAGSCGWGSASHPSGGLTQSHSCIYGTFNVFKGLKLFGVNTLSNSTRPDKDWHKEYQVFIAGVQASPNSTTGGSFSLSANGFNTGGVTALGLLVLSPTALILPDPVTFSELGLQHTGPPLSIEPAFNDAFATHSVTAHAQSVAGSPVPAATVEFTVTGVNGGTLGSGSASTDANGDAVFTYTDTSGGGVDGIQAFIGNAGSNVVDKTWVPHIITLAPLEATNPLNTNHTVTATVTGGHTGNPVSARRWTSR
jgi:hypothetical protein